MLNVQSYYDNYSPSNGRLVTLYIRSDKFYNKYQRKTSDILTVFGDIGGLKEFFLFCGSLLIGQIAQKLFYSNILRRIYHQRRYDVLKEDAKKATGTSTREDKAVEFVKLREERVSNEFRA